MPKKGLFSKLGSFLGYFCHLGAHYAPLGLFLNYFFQYTQDPIQDTNIQVRQTRGEDLLTLFFTAFINLALNLGFLSFSGKMASSSFHLKCFINSCLFRTFYIVSKISACYKYYYIMIAQDNPQKQNNILDSR